MIASPGSPAAAPRGAAVARGTVTAPYLGQAFVCGANDAGTAVVLEASAGEITTNPLARMMACPLGPMTKLTNFSPSAALGAVLGTVMP